MKTCSKCKKPTANFPTTKKGTPSSMCQHCYDWQQDWNAQQHKAAHESRQACPDGFGVCLKCKRQLPLQEFEAFEHRRRQKSRGENARLCKDCRIYSAERAKGYRAEHSPEKKAAILADRREYMRQFRVRVIAAYGGKCTCCGETTPEFLAIDHVNNDGHKHRAEIGYTCEAIYRWAERHGFPKTLQVLCHNCNLAKEFYGSCPHKKAP
jgi:hypothetical protein